MSADDQCACWNQSLKGKISLREETLQVMREMKGNNSSSLVYPSNASDFCSFVASDC